MPTLDDHERRITALEIMTTKIDTKLDLILQQEARNEESRRSLRNTVIGGVLVGVALWLLSLAAFGFFVMKSSDSPLNRAHATSER